MPISAEDDIDDTRYFFRRQLTLIRTQTEILLESADDIDPEDEKALKRILQSSYALSTVIGSPASPDHEPLPGNHVPGRIERLLFCTQNQFLEQIIRENPLWDDHVQASVVTNTDQAREHFENAQADLILIDAVWPDGTGIDVLPEIDVNNTERTPYALLSLYSDETTPVALGLAGIMSPTITKGQLNDALESFVSKPGEAKITGILPEDPGGALGERVNASAETVFFASTDPREGIPTDTQADVVCLSPEMYRALSPTELGRLRTVSPGKGRPVILVESTEKDSHNRDWVPTIGSREFLHCPPDVAGILARLLAYESAGFDGIK